MFEYRIRKATMLKRNDLFLSFIWLKPIQHFNSVAMDFGRTAVCKQRMYNTITDMLTVPEQGDFLQCQLWKDLERMSCRVLVEKGGTARRSFMYLILCKMFISYLKYDTSCVILNSQSLSLDPVWFNLCRS